MNVRNEIITCLTIAAIIILTPGCGRKNGQTPRPPGTSATNNAPSRPAPSAPTLPPGHPPMPQTQPTTSDAQPKPMTDVDISSVKFTEARIPLTGITFSLPEGWESLQTDNAPSSRFASSRKAQFRLPKTDADPEDATVIITHFPGMKGMDQSNIQRWISQLEQPDGRPSVEVAEAADYNLGNVSIKLVDVPGTIRAGGPMMGGGQKKENFRMIAAIVNHAQGPHFVKITGPAGLIERFKPSIVAFLKSAKVDQ